MDPLPPCRVMVYVVHVSSCSEVLEQPTSIPVICRGPVGELSTAWAVGCADYLKEPWTMQELHFRINRVLSSLDIDKSWRGFSIHGNRVFYGDDAITVTVQEQRIFSMLVRHEGTTVPREALYYAIWGTTGDTSRVVDLHISKLRSKMAVLQESIPQQNRVRIVTVRGEGYVIVDNKHPVAE